MIHTMKRRLAIAGLVLGAAAPAASAQLSETLPAPAPFVGSSARVSLAPALSAASGAASSSLYSAEISIAGFGEAASVSGQYQLGGGSAIAVAPASPAMLLSSATPSIVRAVGGETVTLRGIGIAPGGAAPAVRFDGVAASSVSVIAPNEIDAVVPPLLDAVGNSKAAIPVEVEAGGVVATLPMPLIAGPAYLQTSRIRLGDTFTITHHGQPGSLAIPSWAGQLPGFVLPLPGFDGAITLFPIFQTNPVVELLDGSGVSSTVWLMPNLPEFVGVDLFFQSIEITSLAPVAGRFTNAVSARIER